MKKLIVFDWNGTLLADTSACMAADNHVLTTFGGRPVNPREYRENIIIPAVDFYEKFGCNKQYLLDNSKTLGKVFHEFYEPRASKCRTREGTKETLKWLNKNSIDSIILSNHTVTGIKNQLQRLGLNDYISFVLANSELDDSMKGRNKLQKLSDFLSNDKYERNKVVIVGDSPEEIEIGKTLGITTVAITDGYYATHRMKAKKPDYLISNMGQLISIADKQQ